MESRQDLNELHGEEFAENFDQEFDIDSNDAEVEYIPTFRQKAYSALLRFRHSTAVWYVAGFVDALIVIGVASWLM